MVENPDRHRVGDHPRDAAGREWEVFVRPDGADPLRHVGSVSAPSVGVAYEQAETLFAWCADDVWLCPADAVERYSTHTLDDDAERVPVGPDGDERPRES
ncbi:Htur_1727 family rSAM-partnered candidate RiPP [Candidatus Halobonum tyrrellensis]|uniref:Phenylacetic acid degradation protein B n=1 Tax=Candidatus Halobonum tyrrellensis G22 TaxID=1324957 RepID=V4HPM2_9EURY|nr:Htur_1727 family rSAM-partnered candidate RiPP [Candidatus Halobonum tyrrellensis]ESP89844.1 phenylacetic acid degradation protein B [Candidatus Halobonum tyrrellensis G22]